MAKYRKKNYYRYPKKQYPKKRRRKKQMISDNLFVAILFSFVIGFIVWQQTGFDLRSLFVLLAAILILLVVFIFGFIMWQDRQSNKKMLALTQSGVKSLDGFEFENYLKELLKAEGYRRVQVTPAQGDYGADLFAEKDGTSYAIQAKRYADHNFVGVSAVQQISSAREYYDKDVAMVITTSFFTEAAKTMAKKNKVILIDQPKLSEMIRRHSRG